MVMHFDWNAQGFQNQAHFRTHILEAIDWRHWEVTAFDCWTVTCVTAFQIFACGPRSFVRIDLHEAARHINFPANAVENEEFWFWTKVSCIANTGRFQSKLLRVLRSSVDHGRNLCRQLVRSRHIA